MDDIIAIVAVVLVLAYIVFAIWFICTRRSVGQSIGASVGCVCGGLVIIPIAQILATVLCWAVVVLLVIAILGAICSIT